MRVLMMDSLHTELTNCQFFQSSLLNLMRALRQEAVTEESEEIDSTSQAGSTPPTVV